MNPKITSALIFLIVVSTFVAGTVAYPQVGARAAFGLPAILVLLWGLWALFPAIDPAARGFKGFRHVYDIVWVLILGMLGYAYALKLGSLLGMKVDVFHSVIPVIAVLIFVVGLMLPRIRRNWFFGIRTPWTLSSDDVWTRTHRFGRPLFMIAGAVIFVGTFTPREWSIGLLVGAILLASLMSVVYSYLVFRQDQKGGK